MKTFNYLLFTIGFFMVSCNSDADKNGSESEPEEKPFIPCDPIESSWDGERPVDTYFYPVRPGMEEWGFKTSAEMFNACEVPTDVLEKMSTQAIIQTIGENPVMYTLFFSPDYYVCRGYTELALAERNNAGIELTKRHDAGTALLDRLLLVNPFTNMYDGDIMYESQFIELILSQTVFLSQLNECEKRAVVSIAIKNDNLRRTNTDWLKGGSMTLSTITTSLLIGLTLDEARYIPFLYYKSLHDECKMFIEGRQPSLGIPGRMNPYYYNPNDPKVATVMDAIMDFGRDYIKNNNKY